MKVDIRRAKPTFLARNQKIRRFLQGQTVYLIFLVLLVYGMLFVPKFVSTRNLTAILYQYSVIGMLAVGQLFVIISGNIDLSQGATLAFTSITTAFFMTKFGLVPGIAMGMAAAIAVGAVNGLLASKTAMPPFLITLGMMGIVRSLALLVSDSRPISITNEGFLAFGSIDFAGVPLFSLLWFLLALLAAFILRTRRIGLHLYASGSSEENARLSGVRIQKVKFLAYIFCAVLTGIGGLAWTARLRTGSPIGGYNYELESIAAVVIGGASLAGGKGKSGGTLAGVFVFGLISSILNLSHVSPYWQGMAKGIFILAAISIKPKSRQTSMEH